MLTSVVHLTLCVHNTLYTPGVDLTTLFKCIRVRYITATHYIHPFDRTRLHPQTIQHARLSEMRVDLFDDGDEGSV
jgi:hypothetical protein